MRDISYLTLKLTNRCNMNCYMCGQKYGRDELLKDDLPIEVIKECLGQIATLKTVYLFGGEPLLYKEFSQLLQCLSRLNINILISTNGILMDKYCEDIINYKVRDLTLSIDSVRKETFEKIRGSASFDIVFNNLKKLIEMKRNKKSVYPHIGINCVILPENVDELDEIYHFICKNFPDVERINFESPIFTTYEMGLEYEAILDKYFNSKADSWRWFNNRIPKYSKEIIQKIILKMNELKSEPKATFILTSRDKNIDLEEAFSDKYEIPSRKCVFHEYSVTVLPNGDVTYCTDYPDYIVGNIKSNSIEDIFNNSKSKAFRDYIRQKGNLPICARCPRQRCDEDFFIGE